MRGAQKEMLALERYFPLHLREKAEEVLFGLSIFFLSFAVLFNLLRYTEAGSMLWPIAEGLFLVTFALLLKTILIEVYFNYLSRQLEKSHEMSFATLVVLGLHHPQKKDLAKAFLHSRFGQEVMMRLGVAKEMIHYIENNKQHADIALPSRGHFHHLAGHLYDEDPYFRDFLSRMEIAREQFLMSAEHVEHGHRRRRAGKTLLAPALGRSVEPLFSLEHVTRTEVEEFERFYRIIITEQGLQQMVAYFKEDMIRFVSGSERAEFITELIEYSLTAHKERFHGASIILPSDVRSFIISKKAHA